MRSLIDKFLYNKFAFLLAIIFSAAVFSGCAGSRAASNNGNVNGVNAAPTPQIVNISTAPTVSRELPEYFEATGSLVSDAQTDVAPTVSGKVVAVNFDIGSYVQKGGVLVQLDDRDARIRLEQARAQVAQAQSQVEQARANVEQARSNVVQTQARLGLTPGQGFNINNIAEVKTAKATLDLAEIQLRRNERLIESGDVSRSQYDQVRAQLDQARAQYEAALNAANQNNAAIRTAQSAVESAQAVVLTSQRAVDAARTQVDSANKAINDAVIYSPISGSVLERNADLGEFVSTTGKVATIVRTNPLRVRIDVPEQSIGRVRVNQSISLNTSAYPDRQFSGAIARIIPGLNATSRTLTAEAEVNNIDGLLKPGQFATVRILLPQNRTVVMVPVRAVRQEGTTSRIFVINNGRAEQRLVQIGETENDLVEVNGNIKLNEQVAVSNLESLVDGIEVRQ
ncbi:MAG: efflux RND transporter periplasmic adaptor subunit [Pyrinomonadaceae bacterium]